MGRLDEWEAIVHAYTRKHSTQELIEQAQLLRIPVAPVGNEQTLLELDQKKARRVHIEDPLGGFKRPIPPYRIDGKSPAPPRAAPLLGEHNGRIEAHKPARPKQRGAKRLPLEGIRIIDTTSWWAVPIATDMLATLGAEVIHIESVQRIDGARAIGGTFSAPCPSIPN